MTKLFSLAHFMMVVVSLSLDAAAKAPEPAEAASFAGRKVMNGFQLSDFKDFESKWHFVTVRFRKDTNEMRFTYANDSAWSVLQTAGKGKPDYPKGAVFAKIGVATGVDPSFPSSLVPNGARRTQFMVRDEKAFSATDGWGYALFDANGETFPEDPKLTEVACAACHRVVPERSFVFSEPMSLAGLDLRPVVSPGFIFEDQPVSGLPAEVSNHLKGYKSIRSLRSELQKFLFQGTLDEIRPILAAEVIRKGEPAILMSEDGKRFSVVYRDPKSHCSGPKETAMIGVSNIVFKERETVVVPFCF